MPVTFAEWLTYGQTRGWVSAIVCNTHDGLPVTPEEADRWEQGDDPCAHGMRVWPRQITGCDSCGVGPEDECNDDCTIERT